MEVSKCVICSSSLEELCNGKVDVDIIKIFYEILIHRSSRNILPSMTTDNFWSSIFEFSYFCLSCERKVVSIVDLSSDVKSIQTTIKWLVDQMKMKILKSTSTSNFETRNISKVVAKSNVKIFGPTTLSNKIDCFRSLAVVDFNPDVIVIKSDWPTEPLSEDMAHMTKVKFDYFWKMKSKSRSTSSSTISAYKPTKPLLCDTITEGEIVRVYGITKELLTLTNDELDTYFVYKKKKYKCKSCRRSLKNKIYAIKHYVSVHRQIKKWNCGYCGEGYYDRTRCCIHILRDHKGERRKPVTLTIKTPLQEPIEETKLIQCVKCIICYTEFMQSDQQETQRATFFDYCDTMSINYRHPYFQWDSTSADDIPVFCDSCYGSVVTLCDLDNKRKEMLKSINKIVLQMKTEIIVSISQNGEKLNTCKTIYGPGEFYSNKDVDKIDYIRNAAIQELNPNLVLFKVGNYQRLILHRSSNVNKGRAQYKNSLLSLLKDGECINLNPGLSETRLPLTDEEIGFYLEFDPDTRKYKCRECDRGLSTRYCAEDHVNKYHKHLKMFGCKYCEQQFYRKSDCVYHVVNSHISERKTDEIIAAPLPKVKLTTPDGIIDLGSEAAPRLKPDAIKKLPDGKFMCVVCSLVHKNRNSLVGHAKSTHYSMARYQCEFCGFKHLTRCQVTYHVQRVHYDEVKRRNIVFESVPAHVVRGIKKRLKGRTPRGPVDMTGINLVERKHTDADVEEYFTGSGVGFTCKQCGLMYTARLNIKYHVESVHLGIRTCECAICGKRFFKISTCRRHYAKLHGGVTPEDTKHELISDLTSAHDSFPNAPGGSSDGVNNNLITKTDLQNVENLSNSLSVWNRPYSELNDVNKMITEEDCVADFDERNVNNFVKLEAPCISNWQDESEGALAPMESNDAWPSGVSDEIEKNVFNSGYSETNDFSYYETLKLEQEQEVQEIADCWNDPLQSDGEKNSQTGNNKVSKTNAPAVDRKAYIYTLIKEEDVIILPDAEMSDIYKYFKKIGKTRYKCNKCSRILTTDNKAKRHAMEFHNWIKRYQCSKCLKLFGAKFHCAEHFVNKHTRHKLYQCHICENRFSSNTTLKQHIKLHLYREFSCKICPLKFATNEMVKQHCIRVHKSVLQQTVE